MSGVIYVLIVAVEDYNQPKHFRKVKYATKDAEELKKALLLTGIDEENITMLVRANPTKTAIKEEITRISKNATEADRIIFYFSGHGAFDSGENYLLPVDCYNDNIPGTGVSINFILGVLKKFYCKKNILFLDCCHSGFEPGDDTKSRDKSFLGDRLIIDYREEEYTIGFASCKSNQTSITHPKLQHSVWTYFLIQAIKGEAGKIYDHGILFSDKLQTFLKNETKEYVKLNTDDKKDQVPITFGNQTDKFIIADLRNVFEERERSKATTDISLVNVSIIGQEGGTIKSLPGYVKGSHTIRPYKNAATEDFVKTIATGLIEEEISELSKEIKTAFKYKLKEVEAFSSDGSGTINTPDFTYTMEVKQSGSDVSNYILIRKLINFKSTDLVLDPIFNKIFDVYFDKLRISLPRKIDIEAFINEFEELDDTDKIEIDYDPSDLTYCTLKIDSITQEIGLTAQSVSIISAFKTSPQNLIAAYKKAHVFLQANPKLKLLT